MNTASVSVHMPMMKPVVVCVLFIVVAVAGCGTTEDNGQIPMVTNKQWLTSGDPGFKETLQVQFHGTASVLIRVGDTGILMDPFVSNPSIAQVVFLRKLQPDVEMIEQAFPDLSMVKAIAVGHGHYDHLMDVPEVMRRTGDEALLFASRTSVNQVAGEVAKERLVMVNDQLDLPYDPRLWFSVADGDVKIYPIRSEHSPHIFNYRVASGEIYKPMSTVPSDSLDWKQGVNLNFVIQIKNSNLEKPYKVFVQSSSSNAPIGIPPKELLDDIGGVDLAIICAANYDSVEGYPEVMLRAVKPKQLMVIHWDNFLQPRNTEQPNPLPGMDFVGLLERIKQADPALPVAIAIPDAVVKFTALLE